MSSPTGGGQLTALPTGLTALWVWVWKKAEFASGLCRTRQRRVGMLHLHWAQRTGAHMPPPGTQERPAVLSWNPSLVVWVWSEEAASGEAPAALGCSIEGGRRLFLGGLPLRWAARLREGGVCFWGGSRCAGLLDWGGGRRLFLRELPLRGAALLRERGRCFWQSSRCAGLHD